MIFLTRKKIVVAGISVLVIGIIFSAFEFTNRTAVYTAKTTGSLLEATPLNAIDTNKDSDGDTLKDWEEILWKTETHNPDTDGDGTNDGEEVKEGRNPTKKGPNDRFDGGTLDKPAKIEPDKKDLTLTDKLARDIFSQYMLLKQANIPVTEENANELVGTLLHNPEVNTLKNTVYASKDILFSNEDGPVAIKKYGNELGKILLQNPAKKNQTELSILEKALESGELKDVQELDPIIESYKKIMRSVLTLQVPKSAGEIHLQFINNLSYILTIIQGFHGIFDDPTTAIVSLSHYSDSAISLVKSFRDMQAYFQANNVVFGASDTGSALLRI